LAIACSASGQLDRARAEGRKALTTAARRRARPRPASSTTSCAPDAAWTERRSSGTSASITAHSRARDSTSRCPPTRTGRFRGSQPAPNRLFAGAPAPSAARSGARKPSTTVWFRT
jgi:hypothetical protein